jgi:four helix bundle protein
MEKGHADLEVYRRGLALQRPVHALVLRFPDYEKYDLANQMRRACKSVPTNIAEGYARKVSSKEFCKFLGFSLGSANEMEVHFDVAEELGYITTEEHTHFSDEYTIVGKQLTRLIQYWRSKNDATSDQ